MASRLHQFYKNVIVEDLLLKLNLTRISEVPSLRCVTVLMPTSYFERVETDRRENMTRQNPNLMLTYMAAIELMSGRHPEIKYTKGHVAEGGKRAAGVMSRLEGTSAFEFVDKLCSVAMPRVREFQGFRPVMISKKQVQLRLNDIMSFPEIEANYDTFVQVAPMDVIIEMDNCRSAHDSHVLLSSLGLVFDGALDDLKEAGDAATAEAEKKVRVEKERTFKWGNPHHTMWYTKGHPSWRMHRWQGRRVLLDQPIKRT